MSSLSRCFGGGRATSGFSQRTLLPVRGNTSASSRGDGRVRPGVAGGPVVARHRSRHPDTAYRVRVGEGDYYQQWAADNRHRTKRQYIKALRNRAPFTDVFAESVVPGEIEHEYDGKRVEGIGAAHLMGGLVVSLPVSAAWDRSWLDVNVRRLVENAHGEVATEEEVEPVRHASRPGNLVPHEQWGRSSGLDAIDSAARLWEERMDFFPSLRFLPRGSAGPYGFATPGVRTSTPTACTSGGVGSAVGPRANRCSHLARSEGHPGT
jgi:hypothetical protein